MPLRYLARALAHELVRELVCDLLMLASITLSRSQNWSQTGSGHIPLRYPAR